MYIGGLRKHGVLCVVNTAAERYHINGYSLIITLAAFDKLFR